MPRVLVAGDFMVKYSNQYLSPIDRRAVEVAAFKGIRNENLFSHISDRLADVDVVIEQNRREQHHC